MTHHHAERMGRTLVRALAVSAIAFTTLTSAVWAQTIVPDLRAVSTGAGWHGDRTSASLTDKDGAPAVLFSTPRQHLVWLDGFEFSEGVIEFDVRGRNVPQGSFPGIAFRVIDARTYDAVYFRPFNFHATDSAQRAHAVQYESEPDNRWDRLRKEFPGQYEQPLPNAPSPDDWFHVRVVVEGRQVRVYVNDATQPALTVTELSARRRGSVGVFATAYGAIANLRITPKAAASR